jgi:hypothetical protein
MFRSFAIASLLSLSSLVVGCAPDSGLEDGSEEAQDDESALSLNVQVINVTKSNADPGLTIIKKKADYVAFFGVEPPPGLSFNSSWVLHYSMGGQNSGGYAAGIPAVEREGVPGDKRLVVHTTDTSPGPNCFVTLALTNPQVTVKIPKQNNSIGIDQTNESFVTDCGTVQNWCAAALCGPGMVCDEFTDACVEEPFCPKVKCANGYECSEDLDQCIGRICDPDNSDCPANFACENQIACVTTPCPTEFRCEPAPEVTCDQIGWEGICQGTTLKYCNGDEMVTQSCSPGQCEWDEANAYYDCN